MIVRIDLDALYRAWRQYLIDNSVCRNFAAFNDNSVAKFPAASLELIGTPTMETDLVNNEETINLTVKTSVAINNDKILQLQQMNDACREFFNSLGFQQFGDSLPQTINKNVHQISSRFVLRNFNGQFLIDLENESQSND
jgi:hypothetical protein